MGLSNVYLNEIPLDLFMEYFNSKSLASDNYKYITRKEVPYSYKNGTYITKTILELPIKEYELDEPPYKESRLDLPDDFLKKLPANATFPFLFEILTGRMSPDAVISENKDFYNMKGAYQEIKEVSTILPEDQSLVVINGDEVVSEESEINLLTCYDYIGILLDSNGNIFRYQVNDSLKRPLIFEIANKDEGSITINTVQYLLKAADKSFLNYSDGEIIKLDDPEGFLNKKGYSDDLYILVLESQPSESEIKTDINGRKIYVDYEGKECYRPGSASSFLNHHELMKSINKKDKEDAISAKKDSIKPWTLFRLIEDNKDKIMLFTDLSITETVRETPSEGITPVIPHVIVEREEEVEDENGQTVNKIIKSISVNNGGETIYREIPRPVYETIQKVNGYVESKNTYRHFVEVFDLDRKPDAHFYSNNIENEWLLFRYKVYKKDDNKHFTDNKKTGLLKLTPAIDLDDITSRSISDYKDEFIGYVKREDFRYDSVKVSSNIFTGKKTVRPVFTDRTTKKSFISSSNIPSPNNNYYLFPDNEEFEELYQTEFSDDEIKEKLGLKIRNINGTKYFSISTIGEEFLFNYTEPTENFNLLDNINGKSFGPFYSRKYKQNYYIEFEVTKTALTENIFGGLNNKKSFVHEDVLWFGNDGYKTEIKSNPLSIRELKGLFDSSLTVKVDSVELPKKLPEGVFEDKIKESFTEMNADRIGKITNEDYSFKNSFIDQNGTTKMFIYTRSMYNLLKNETAFATTKLNKGSLVSLDNLEVSSILEKVVSANSTEDIRYKDTLEKNKTIIEAQESSKNSFQRLNEYSNRAITKEKILDYAKYKTDVELATNFKNSEETYDQPEKALPSKDYKLNLLHFKKPLIDSFIELFKTSDGEIIEKYRTIVLPKTENLNPTFVPDERYGKEITILSASYDDSDKLIDKVKEGWLII